MEEVEEETYDVDQFLKEESANLKNSKLNKFYSKLDSYLVSGTNRSHYCSANISDPKIHNLCYSLENRIFKKWRSLRSILGSSKHKCYDYLNYWLYGKLSEYNSEPLDSFQFYKGLEEIFKAKVTGAPSGTYNKHFEQVTYQETLKNKKELHDFSEYFDYIIRVINGADSGKKGKYCQYVSHILRLYHNLKNEYSTELSKRYDKEFKLFEGKFKTESDLTSLIEKCGMYYAPTVSEKDEEERSPLLRENVPVETPRHVQMPRDLNMNTIQAGLPSKEIYDELNKVEGSTYYDNYCKYFDRTNHELKPLCRKIVRNLKNISENKIMKNLNQGDRCLHFIFWAYDEIGKKFNWPWRNVYNIPEAKSLLDVWSKVSMEALQRGSTHRVHMASRDIDRHCILRDRNGSCIKHKFITGDEDDYALKNYNTCLYYINCSSNECKEMKALYDYFYNFSDIKKKVTTASTCPTHNAYLSYIAKLYEKYRQSSKGDCCRRRDCDDFFKCDEDLNPKNLQKLSVCGGVQTYSPRGVTPQGLTARVLTQPGLTQQGLTERGLTERGLTERGLTQQDLTPRAGEETYDASQRSRLGQRNPDESFSYDGDHYHYDGHSHGPGHMDDGRVGNTRHAVQDQSAENNSGLFDFSDYRNNIRLFTVIGGVFLLAFGMYRYTPAGKWFNSKNRKKIKLDDFQFEENTEDAATYATGYNDENSPNRTVYLGYYPSDESVYQ
ncbi:variable surface protein Vir24-like protein [Plasmodium vivax India VII]|uniref:Variable surface protein Vir24-like protein n=1 Tax=Plasmodium vivax India VII TaxID=1077284 RepID=A0A0J9SE18_PLAVI|nr:variable surface protein Vir24-like protein [Plasmodium vivax India VII]